MSEIVIECQELSKRAALVVDAKLVPGTPECHGFLRRNSGSKDSGTKGLKLPIYLGNKNIHEHADAMKIHKHGTGTLREMPKARSAASSHRRFDSIGKSSRERI